MYRILIVLAFLSLMPLGAARAETVAETVTRQLQAQGEEAQEQRGAEGDGDGGDQRELPVHRAIVSSGIARPRPRSSWSGTFLDLPRRRFKQLIPIGAA